MGDSSHENKEIKSDRMQNLQSLHSSGKITNSNLRRDEENTFNVELIYLPSGIYFKESRHKSIDEQTSFVASDSGVVSKWRMKDRMKTGCVAIVLCLNIGVDPPDVIKISPCARMECWIDPFSIPAQKALDAIGKNLQTQYERWQPKAKYKVQLDPTVEEVKKLCTSCRKSAKAERVLFHYNGHGVPKPTPNGEIWMFNKSYTQYIPLSVYELESWLGSPSIYVFDCSSAGMIINAFCDRPEWGHGGVSFSALKDCILLASCSSEENLPQNPEFPADIFTSCLTTPIEIALKWFCRRSLLKDILKPELIDEIPGRQNDRKTPLGELNWIFTAITDTIAWNVLPRELFQRLFRQDLLVASLFRNFLLADRILRAANCTPVSYPHLPPTHQHPMWHAWDMAAEICLSQLPALLKNPNIEFKPSPFFSEQLTAFEVWLENGSEKKKPPEQLPIVLQVLLSQSHRLRALILLGRFLDMGPWAVDLALSVGIFPYVLKLLQTTSTDLRHVLVFIWAKILALDKSCQVDLVKDNGHQYFIKVLDSSDTSSDSSNPSLLFFQKALSAFVLSVISDHHQKGQTACIQSGLISICISHIQKMVESSSSSSSSTIPPIPSSSSSPSPSPSSNVPPPSPPSTPEKLYLQWLCLCVAKTCEGFDHARLFAIREHAHHALSKLLSNSQPEVRSAAAFSLGLLINIESENSGNENSVIEGNEEFDEDEMRFSAEKEIGQRLLTLLYDCSPLVRRELIIALYRLARAHKKYFKFAALTYLKPSSTIQSMNSRSYSSNSIHFSPQIGISFSSLNLSLNNLQSASTSSFLTRSYDAKSSSSNPMNSPPKDDTDGINDKNLMSNNQHLIRPSVDDQNLKSTFKDSLSQTNNTLPFHSLSEKDKIVLHDEKDNTTNSLFPNQLSRSRSIGEESTIDNSNNNNILINGMKTSNSTSSNFNHIEENIIYIKFVMAMYTLLRDPMPQISKLAHLALKCIGIEQVFIRGDSQISTSASDVALSSQSTSSDHPSNLNLNSNLGLNLNNEPNSAFKSSTSNPSPRHTRISSFSGFPPYHANSSIPRSTSWVNFTTVPPHGNTGWRNNPSQSSPNPQQNKFLSSNETLRKVSTTIDFNSPIKSQSQGQHQCQSPHQITPSVSNDFSPSISSPAQGTKFAHLNSSNSSNKSKEDVDDVIFHSQFYDWSFNYFSKPLLQTIIDDENDFIKEKHEMIAKEAIQKFKNGNLTKVSDQIASCDTESNMSTQFVLLHPFSPLVCIADEKEFIRVWNYEEGVMANMFDNNCNNLKKKNNFLSHKLISESGISKLCFVNELYNSLLLVASCDGNIRVWENFSEKNRQNLVTAWHSVPKFSRKAKLEKSVKVVVDWNQSSGYLFASGESSSVLAWDLNTENLAQNILTKSESPLTSISSSQSSPNFFLSGCGDGYVRVFDIRTPNSLVIASQVHNHRLIGIDYQSCTDSSLIVSASSQGDIKFLDLRRNGCNYLSVNAHKGNMTALSVHKHARVIASGSAKQYIKVFNLSGEQLSTICYHNSFLGQRIGPISSLNFHPYNVLLAAGATDSMVSIYAGESSSY